MAETSPTLLVVSAHAGDFVWRAGGAIAAATMRGERAVVVCLSYGERGESASQWLQGKPLDEIKAIRRDEAEGAAAALSASSRRIALISSRGLPCSHWLADSPRSP